MKKIITLLLALSYSVQSLCIPGLKKAMTAKPMGLEATLESRTQSNLLPPFLKHNLPIEIIMPIFLSYMKDFDNPELAQDLIELAFDIINLAPEYKDKILTAIIRNQCLFYNVEILYYQLCNYNEKRRLFTGLGEALNNTITNTIKLSDLNQLYKSRQFRYKSIHNKLLIYSNEGPLNDKNFQDFLDSLDEEEQTKLKEELSVNNLKQLDTLLQNKKLDINTQDKSHRNWTALMYAAHNGNLSVVKKLMQHGADPRKKSSWYLSSPISTALTITIINNQAQSFIKSLIKSNLIGIPIDFLLYILSYNYRLKNLTTDSLEINMAASAIRLASIFLPQSKVISIADIFFEHLSTFNQFKYGLTFKTYLLTRLKNIKNSTAMVAGSCAGILLAHVIMNTDRDSALSLAQKSGHTKVSKYIRKHI